MRKNLFYLAFLFVFTMMNAQSVTVGEGGTLEDDNIGFNTPITNYYGYNMSQTIYLASEINASGEINSLQYYLNSATLSIDKGDDMIDVWIGHTDKSQFNSIVGSNGADIFDVSTLTQVVTNGSLSRAGNVVTLELDTPFNYNGTDNLVVVLNAKEADYNGSNMFYYQFESDQPLGMNIRNDDTVYNPSTVTRNFTGGNGTNSWQEKLLRPVTTINIGEDGGEPEPGDGGSTCEDAIAVTSLPYDHAGNTADYGDNIDYTADTFPPLSPNVIGSGTVEYNFYYMNGDDVVYTYTPTENQTINVSTTNDGWAGLFAFTGCPFETTIGYSTGVNAGTRAINGLSVTAGQTYYFVISTWSPPQNTAYTIHIELAGDVEPGEGPCAEKTIMECGVTYTQTLIPGAGEWTNYTDVTWNYTGSEKVWEFTAPSTGSYTFIVDAGDADADFFLMDACSNTANNLITNALGYWTGSNASETIVLTEGVTYYLIADLFSSSTTTVSVSVNCPDGGEEPEPGDYCEPAINCTDGDVITHVLFAGIDNPTDCSSNGYGDYTDQIANVEAGATYPISISVGAGWYERVSLWIDFGNDGSFDPEDFFGEIGDGGQGVVLEDEIAIPAGVADGQYRMRIFAYAAGSDEPASEDPCINNLDEYGEYEDYTVNVGELGISNLNAVDFAFYPNPVKDVLNISAKKNVESVSVFNLAGQQLLSNAKVSNGQINVNTLTAGTYVFRVTLEGGQVETFKIIKK